jgi:NADPH:quinone reductase-like Zn-dependent oxidoreductase
MPKIVRFHKTGEADVLQLEELPTPVPRQNEVRIRVEAIGLNRAEVMFRQGAYLEQPQLPSLIGYEASGVVEELGQGVADLRPGDKVSSIPSFSMTQYGTYGEVAVLPAYSLAKYPSRLSSVEAAAIWMQYLTAYGLVEFGRLHEGDHLLITAAASSVGLAAIQIANALGAKPIATTRNLSKESTLRDAGAHHVVNTASDRWIEHVREITGEKGIDLAFDPVAGPGLERIAQIVREEGTIFVYGALASEPTLFPLFAAIGKNLTFRGYSLFSIVKDPDRSARAKRWVYDQVSAGKLQPVIARTFPLSEIVEAHRYMESNEQFGKIIVTV